MKSYGETHHGDYRRRMRLILDEIPTLTRVYVGVVIALLGILILRDTGDGGADTVAAPDLPRTVERIEIRDHQSSLVLESTGGEQDRQWLVHDDTGERYQADDGAVERLLERIRDLSDLPVVTRRGNLPEYGLVDPHLRTVRVLGDSSEKIRIDIGTSAPAGDAVFGRIGEGTEVLRLPRAVYREVSTNPEDYRDMVVVSISEEETRRISIESARVPPVELARADTAAADRADDDPAEEPTREPTDRSAHVHHTESAWRASGLLLEEIGGVAPERIRDLFQELSALRAAGFVDDSDEVADGGTHVVADEVVVGGDPETDRDSGASPVATIVIETGAGSEDAAVYRLRISPPDEHRRFRVGGIPGEAPFYLAEWRVRRLLLGIEAYLAPYTESSPRM